MYAVKRINFSKPVIVTLLLAALLAMGNIAGNLVSANGIRPLGGFVVDSLTGGAARESKGIDSDDRASSAPLESESLVGALPDGAIASSDSLPTFGDQVIKTGSLTLEVKRGHFYRTYDEVLLVARRYGGYVSGSNSSSRNDRSVSGSISIRMPSENFEAAMTKLRKLGKIAAINISSVDTSGEFVDLKSRLRHWRAQESVLLGLMQKADTITESITIQQQLAQIQMEIEQITGRLNYLKDQTSFSSISLTINEPGTAPTPIDPWGLEATIAVAAQAFTNTLKGLIVLAGYFGPLALLGGAWLAVRSARRRVKPAQSPA